MQDDEILIGEGVALSTGAAPVTMRMLSGAIDVLVYGGTALASFLAIANTLGPYLNGALWRAVVIGAIVVTLVLLPTLVETLTRGLSPGRLALGLRVVRDDSGPIAFRHAFIRAFVGLAEVYLSFGMIAITTSMLSARGKRLGDMLAGTYAMRVRGGAKALPPLAMPPHLEAWASAADIRRLPDGLALTSRMFLARAAALRPDSRARLGNDLGERVFAHVSPPPPEGTHPEYAIAAVLVERGRREYAIEMDRQRRGALEERRVGALPYGVIDVDN
ncbi:RDD family protein [Demequina sp. NBRC 110051]|uniref:RDD family protein n=1 Tax=Demequina sp. NBRC 110051 TaxID=1570340 RepID=UPI0009FC51B7|nr:RDD family protein [Demequina sp. NBRC 110051]